MDYATDKKTFHNDIYKNMTLREELEHRFEQYEDEKKMNELYDKYIKPMEKKENYEKCYYSSQNYDALQQAKNASFYQNCAIGFNGTDLGLFKNGKTYDTLSGMSGNSEYQCANYQNMENTGPIPEGIYFINQNRRQNIGMKDAIFGIGKRGGWPGSTYAWGMKRAWLEPDQSNEMYGRNKFSIHGGFSKGSAGCIDIPWQTEKLSNYLDNCQQRIPVYVKYNRKCW